ncbi:hypothetical protein [Alloactinosynnema sp. L-07]|uniref:hypothetical protein n=1 Tax=Alloactinosynnema sp. L-07 TaxID=1653480 RepID=UPI00065EFB33|nr:hypothetical protein [Alloactinosynnema sp. L-07]CRK59037.1 hypothetical protein [Alloactinosynnema sp. L-07]
MTDYDLTRFAEDGVTDDPLPLQLRVPLISNPYPRWNYLTAVVVNDQPPLWLGLRPTDHELRMVGSFHQEYIEYWYSETWKQKMRELPFDCDGGYNSVIFIKNPNGGWGYRRRTWSGGPTFVPGPSDEPSPLIAVMDGIHTFGSRDPQPGPRWTAWKTAHADLFGAAAAEVARG